MKVLYFEWNSFCNEDCKEAFKNLGFDIISTPFDKNGPRRDPNLEASISSIIENEKPDFAFSFNYFPIIATVCHNLGTTYVSWVYDCPHVTLFSYTLIFETNRVFLFDKAEFLRFNSQGIKTVYYLPLAANAKRINALIESTTFNEKYGITFVGSLYNEKRVDASKLKVSPDGVETLGWLKEQYIDNREATSRDRLRLLNASAKLASTTLFTTSDTSLLSKNISVQGYIDSYDKAPFIYRNSKVNLCITLKSIRTGIPLRVFEIMAAKGPLLINKQSDMDDLFIEGEDYLCYKDDCDFKKKANKLLTTDSTAMVESAYQKVLENCTFEQRIKEMLSRL